MAKLTSTFGALLLICLFLTSCNAQVDKNTSDANPKFSISSPEYEQLAEQALRHIEKFQFADLYRMVSDDIEYYLPDGGEKSRTRFIGREAFQGFWDTYQEKSGNSKIVLSNTVHIPVIAKDKLNYTKMTGVMVISYFSLDMTFGDEVIDMRMNWGLHFNEDKQIDKIYSYYDRTPIIEAAKRNLLSKE